MTDFQIAGKRGGQFKPRRSVGHHCDGSRKFAVYQQLDSSREYVLVDQDRIRVQIYRRSDGQWWIDSIGPGGRLSFESMGLACPVQVLYKDLSD